MWSLIVSPPNYRDRTAFWGAEVEFAGRTDPDEFGSGVHMGYVSLDPQGGKKRVSRSTFLGNTIVRDPLYTGICPVVESSQAENRYSSRGPNPQRRVAFP